VDLARPRHAAHAVLTPRQQKVVKARLDEAGFDLYGVSTRSIRAAYTTLRALDKRQSAFTDNFILKEVGRLFIVLVR
jgi:hypothetical protein